MNKFGLAEEYYNKYIKGTNKKTPKFYI